LPEKRAVSFMGRYSLAFVGGFDLASQWMGWENVFQVEWDSYCQKVLAKNFPNVKRYEDIRDFDGRKYRGQIDIITGGFPCQPFSVAGKQKGKSDDRYLWPEMLRVIREIQPAWIVGENVPGITGMVQFDIPLEMDDKEYSDDEKNEGSASVGEIRERVGRGTLEEIMGQLENEGYEVQPFIIPSASIGAWDKRERVWIIAYNNKLRGGKLPIQQRGQNKAGHTNTYRQAKISPDTGLQRSEINEKQAMGSEQLSESNSNTNIINGHNAGYNSSTISQQQKAEVQFNNIADTIGSRRENGLHGGESERQTRKRINSYQEPNWWKRNWIEVASELCRSNARVPNRVHRIKALGNSVNPYVPYQIFKAIETLTNRDN
jgi:DNA-cytosine methyltransferase